jgi:CRP-like cAMP-binding protein
MEMVSHAGPHVLVVEDDFFLAEDICVALRNANASVMGPFATLDDAREALVKGKPDAAVVDIDLAGQVSFPLVETLQKRGIPIVLSTGVGTEFIPDAFSTIPRLEKPYGAELVATWLNRAFEPEEGQPVASAQPFGNILLTLIAPTDMAKLRPYMSRVRLRPRTVLLRPHQPISRVYFPETCMCSFLAGSRDDIVEAGIIGAEGMVGSAILAGVSSAPYQVIVQFQGEAIAVAAPALRSAVSSSAHLASIFLQSQYLFQLQLAHNALALATASVEQRLARWLLMCQDRVGDDLSIVHEFLSLMLHVRRPSVTLAMQSLEKAGAISAGRGRLKIENRQHLVALSGANYGVVENEQRRIFMSAN